MTLIIGIEDPQQHRAIMFSDSGVWRNNSRADSLSEPKIWRDGEFVVGVSGNVAHLQAIRRIKLNPVPTAAPAQDVIEELGRWGAVCLGIIAAQNSSIRTAIPEMQISPHHILVAHGARIFHVQDQAAIRVERGWCSIGDWEYAEGALSALSDRPPFQQGERAMRAVDAIVDSVRAPFRWMATDGTEGELEESDEN